MRVILACFAVVVLAYAVLGYANDNSLKEWLEFKAKHSKTYSDPREERKRLEFFKQALSTIAEHKRQRTIGARTYELALNKFADMSPDEIKVRNGLKRIRLRNADQGSTFLSATPTALPQSVDWRNNGAVTPVQDQGHCGSCWAFVATGALETQNFRKTGKLVSLSKQNLVDCSSKYGNNGCDGGWMNNAYRYIKDNGGVSTEAAYPYTAVVGTCRFNSSTVGATLKSFVNIPSGDEQKLAQAVANNGTVGVGVDASLSSFHYYSSGVYNDAKCNATAVNHAMLIVGYGTDATAGDFWILKNTWGTGWGINGYMKIARNVNMCGIASFASFPTV